VAAAPVMVAGVVPEKISWLAGDKVVIENGRFTFTVATSEYATVLELVSVTFLL